MVVDEKRRNLFYTRGQDFGHADITTVQFTKAVVITFRTETDS